MIVLSLVKASPVQSTTMPVIPATGITLTVDFGNGTISEYNDLVGNTVLEVTSSVLDVEVQWFGPFAYIRSIEGFVGQGEHGWQYWVNGEFASVAVSHYLLGDDYEIEWVYSTPDQQQQYDPSFIPGVVIVSTSGFGFIAIVYVGTSRRIK